MEHRNDGKLHIVVSDPVKQGEGMNSYVSYKVITTSSLLISFLPDSNVIRRYSDFVWLNSTLALEYPGIIIPPLPDKAVVGRFTPEFVEERRKGLERGLMRIAAHPELLQSKYFKIFLEGNDEAFNVAKEESKKLAANGGVGKFFGGIFGTILGDAPKVKSEEDIKFEEVRKYTNVLSSRLENVQRHTNTMLQRQQDMGASMADFGLCFALLGQCEGASLGKGLDELGKTADALSHLTQDMAKTEMTAYQEPLTDLSKIMQAIESAFLIRDEKLSAYHAAVAAVNSAKQSHEKLAQSPGKEAKVPAAKEDVTKAEAQLEECTKQMSIVNERMSKEIDRFKAQKLIDLKKMTMDYVQRQIEYSKKMEAAYSALLPSINSITLEVTPTTNTFAGDASTDVPPPLPEKKYADPSL